MKTVFLYHGGKIQHYRINVYNYLHNYLKNHGYYFKVITEGHQLDSGMTIYYPEEQFQFTYSSLVRFIRMNNPWANILFIYHREPYFYPLLIYLRATGKKVITWTHGINFQNKSDKLSRIAHHIEHSLCQRIILYSEDSRNYLLRSHRKKAFVANNTLNLTDYVPDRNRKKEILQKYNINTRKNIVYSGRMDPRKRVGDLLEAFDLIKDNNIGLILIGPDDFGILTGKHLKNPRIFYLGPLYGKNTLDVLSASDVSCIPGAVGLSIVDSMYCGLPVVIEDVDHGPEIMYFKNGINGYMVPRGNIHELAEKLMLLLNNDVLRDKLGYKAREEIIANGHIDSFCKGFLACLRSLEKT